MSGFELSWGSSYYKLFINLNQTVLGKNQHMRKWFSFLIENPQQDEIINIWLAESGESDLIELLP